MLSVTILGNNSAIPAHGRHPTSQVVNVNDQLFLVDCGEGTQMQMSRYCIRKNRIQHIFISHLHGDHYFGLIGLINTYGLLKRTEELNIYGPGNLKNIIDVQLKCAGTELPFTMNFHAIEDEGVLVETDKIKISAFKVFHRIETYGFLFEETVNKRKVIADKAKGYEIPFYYYEKLQDGLDYERKDGLVVKNEWVTIPHKLGKSYAYCADTLFNPVIAEKINGVDMIYHESTFIAGEEERASSRYHSTCTQAAQIAQLANTKKLLLGHFSSKHIDLKPFLEQACTIFQNTHLAYEGATFIAE